MSEAAPRADANRTLMAAILASVAMLFTAFAAAYMERRAASGEWSRIAFPGLVWVNTAILALSSVTVEVARRTGKSGFMHLTIVLGLLFLAGQLAVWRELRASGVFLPSSAHGSFFYVLTGLHGVHLLAGLIALLVAAARPAIRGLCAGFWHFMGAVWLYVLLVLLVL